MKRIKLTLSLSISLIALLFFSSCESSKIAFGNSYYFKQTPKESVPNKEVAKSEEQVEETTIQHNEQAMIPEHVELKVYASTEAVMAKRSIQEKIEKVEQRIEKVQKFNELEQKRKAEKLELSKAEAKAFKKEKKNEQKALKKEIKSLAKEYKRAPEEVQKEMAVSGNTRTGIILGAVGLILLIIGGPVLYTVGAILLVVGLVLILIDVL